MEIRAVTTLFGGILLALSCGTAAEAADIGRPEICKAVVSTLMGRSPAIMRTDGRADGAELISYVRDDGSLWSYRCKIEGTVVIWGSADGRWRDQVGDEQLSYVLSSDRQSLIIRETSGGSVIEKRFTAADF